MLTVEHYTSKKIYSRYLRLKAKLGTEPALCNISFCFYLGISLSMLLFKEIATTHSTSVAMCSGVKLKEEGDSWPVAPSSSGQPALNQMTMEVRRNVVGEEGADQQVMSHKTLSPQTSKGDYLTLHYKPICQTQIVL